MKFLKVKEILAIFLIALIVTLAIVGFSSIYVARYVDDIQFDQSIYVVIPMLFVFWLVLLASLLLLRRGLQKRGKENRLSKIELAMIALQFLSFVPVLIITIGTPYLVQVGIMLLLVIGIIRYYKQRDELSASFVLCEISALMLLLLLPFGGWTG